MSKMSKTILVNVDRCLGCWTCSLACKVAYDLPVDEHRLYVRTIGGGGVDVPAGQWPNLSMKWMPVYKTSCIDCRGCSSTDDMPYCVYNCTTEALTYGDLDDPASPAAREMTRLKNMGYHAYELSAWEGTKPGVVYLEKGL
ncbi:hypothetical protein [Adlercreutzia sp. ZJ242]|uniref:hypothetical protein n=1 Tax=Adlercreutzia sp. ZJ242 TaxID=2709409 RepID=UPI0013E9C3B7|nr:hypothetical protein [Adlercreutzia sp. ZJ242]